MKIEDVKPAKNDDKGKSETAEVKVAKEVKGKADAAAEKVADRAEKSKKEDAPKSESVAHGKSEKAPKEAPFEITEDIFGVTEGNNGNHFGQLKVKKPKSPKHSDSESDSDSDSEPVPSPTATATGTVDPTPSVTETQYNTATTDGTIIFFRQQAPVAPELSSDFQSDSAPVSEEQTTLAEAPVAPVAVSVNGGAAQEIAAP